MSSPESYSAWAGVAGLPDKWKVPDVCCEEQGVLLERGEWEAMSRRFTMKNPTSDCMYEPSHTNTFTEGCADKILLYAQILFYGIPSIMFVRSDH